MFTRCVSSTLGRIGAASKPSRSVGEVMNRSIATTTSLRVSDSGTSSNQCPTHMNACNCPCTAARDKTFYNRTTAPNGDVASSSNLHTATTNSLASWQTQRSVDAHKERTQAYVAHLDKHGAARTSRLYSSGSPDTDYAFEMTTSSVRYGHGVTQEVGADLAEMGVQNVCVMTDANLVDLYPVQTTLQSLNDHNIRFTLYDRVRVEPNDISFKEAIKFATEGQFDCFVAVGGGSVIDTCKAANLYSSHPPDDFLDYVNPPLGKGLPPPGDVKPLIAIPTTAGTGSETTGVSIFDLTSLNAKTGIAHRKLRPILGIVDPINTYSMPPGVAAASGFDVLSHSIESLTALNFASRSPRPKSPLYRPAYQGSNPISDHWSAKSLEMTANSLQRAVQGDLEARSEMMLASTYAGIGFGNAGVHLCHGMSYPVAGMTKSYKHPGYNPGRSLIPHGVSVIVNAPAVFRFTCSADPSRHRHAASLLGADTSGVSDDDIGKLLADRLLVLMHDLGIPDGLSAMGYSESDIPALVEGTIPQERVTRLSPKPVGRPELNQLFSETMRIY